MQIPDSCSQCVAVSLSKLQKIKLCIIYVSGALQVKSRKETELLNVCGVRGCPCTLMFQGMLDLFTHVFPTLVLLSKHRYVFCETDLLCLFPVMNTDTEKKKPCTIQKQFLIKHVRAGAHIGRLENQMSNPRLGLLFLQLCSL